MLSRSGWRVGVAFGILGLLLAVQMAHELVGFTGSGYSTFIDSYAYDVVIAGCCVLILVRARGRPRERGLLLIGLATFSWLVGDIVWDLTVSGTRHQHLVTAADGFWLMWYPLAVAGVVMLVRSRLSGFDLARWIDGIALALLAATPAVALALQPAIEESHLSVLTHTVLIAYPAFDVLLLGAAVGVIGLAGWRLDRAWYLLALGFSMWMIADALYSIQQTDSAFRAGVYDYLWPAGMLLLAAAAWQPRSIATVREPIGWRAIALPVACQVVAFTTQIWGLVVTLGDSERIMTMAILAIAIVQLSVSRPRVSTPASGKPDATRQPPPDPPQPTPPTAPAPEPYHVLVGIRAGTGAEVEQTTSASQPSGAMSADQALERPRRPLMEPR